jgi:hypothetical protein
VSAATGLARQTIANGRRELADGVAATTRIRRAGAGRPGIVYAQADALGNRKPVAFSFSTKERFILPVGQYEITVKKGAATTTQDIQIRAGQIQTANIVLNAGIVDVIAVFASDGRLAEGPRWSVFGAPDALGNQKPVAFSYSTKERFTLSAGRYTLSVEKDGAAATQDIQIQPGKRIESRLVLKN